jgi:hypothetical protein
LCSQTTSSWVQGIFLDREEAAGKLLILTVNKHHWGELREDVADYIEDYWMLWKATKPEWFNAGFINRLDDDLLPAEEAHKLKRGKPRKKKAIGWLQNLMRESGSWSGIKSAKTAKSKILNLDEAVGGEKEEEESDGIKRSVSHMAEVRALNTVEKRGGGKGGAIVPVVSK